MSEQHPSPQSHPANLHEATLPLDMQPEQLNAHDVVNGVMHRGIEVQDPEQLAANIGVLQTTYELQGQVLAEPRNQLLLAAIAHKVGSEPLNTETPTGQYVTDLMALSFGDYTNMAGALAQEKQNSGFSEEVINAAYEQLTDQELSGELQSYIDQNPDFVSLRTRLGVTPEEESPFEVRVLRVSDANMLYGWEPSMSESDTELKPWEFNDKKRMLGQELIDNGAELARVGGSGLAPAWVRSASDGTKTLCMPLPAAEKLVRNNVSKNYRDKDLERDAAILQHEYTHTQRMVTRPGYIGTGTALEELRAEHFSGDKHGYTEIKRYFRALKVVQGHSVEDSFEPGGAPYDSDEFEYDIARKGGLEGYLDAMTLVPRSYVHDNASIFLRHINQIDGGVDGHFRAMYDRTIATDGEATVLARVDAHIDVIREKLLGDQYVTPEAFFNYANPELYRRMLIGRFRQRYPHDADGVDYFPSSIDTA